MKHSTQIDTGNSEPPREWAGEGTSHGEARAFWIRLLAGWAAFAGLVVVVGWAEEADPVRSALHLLPPFLLSLPLAGWRRTFPRRESGFLRAAGVHLLQCAAYAVTSGGLSVFLLGLLGPFLPTAGADKPQPGFGNFVAMAVFLYLVLATYLEWQVLARRVREAQQRAARESVLRAQAEATAVRARFNPHFVFNTLHSLLTLVRSDPDSAEKAIQDVADLIRYASTLDRRGQDTVRFGQELEITRKYLGLEALRLDDRLNVVWDLSPNLDGVRVPALCLQVLVENAVKHGIAPKPEGGTIHVSAVVAGTSLTLRVKDDGMGADPDAPGSGNMNGLDLLQRRIALLHGDAASLSWSTRPGGGFTVTVELPLSREPGNGKEAPMPEPGLERPISVLLCEDEPLAMKALRDHLRDVPWLVVVGEAKDGREALRLIQKEEPDLVFLDVQMPGLTGLEVLEALTHEPAIVFTTAYEEYALPAFEHGAVDYLLKPFGKERLLQALGRIRVKLVGEGMAGAGPAAEKRRSPSRLFACHRNRIVPVPTGEIIRVDAEEGGASLVTEAGNFHLDRTLTELEGRLDPMEFVRIHRAHLVNLAHVKGIRRYDDRRFTVDLSDGSRLLTSRAGAKAIRSLMD